MPKSKTTTGFALPEQESAFLEILEKAQGLFDKGGPRFPSFRTFVPQSRETLDALRGIADVARQGSPVFDAASQRLAGQLRGDFSNQPGLRSLAETASGQFLSPDSNPFLRDIFARQVAPGIRDNVNSSFIGSGRFGSAANTRVLADSLGNAANQLFGESFAKERANQLTAAQQLANEQFRAVGLAPTFQQARFSDLGQLANVGAAREAFSGTQLQDRINRFNFAQNRPIENLARLQSFTLGGPVLTSTIQQAPKSSGGFLNNILKGASLGVGAGPAGALVGGGIGGLIGLL
ncbi:MAG: hypothetical protein MI806_22530 [Minwuiales bacterium]|nr:hypothetical protein [Minwuiales bacterium]